LRIRTHGTALAAAFALAIAPAASAAPTHGTLPGNFDLLAALHDVPAGAAPAAPARVSSARVSLARSLGRQAVVDIDPLTSTVRNLQRLDGALSGPAAGDPAQVALRFVGDNAAALGLSRSDLGSLSLAHRDVSPEGVTRLRWTQSYQGVPIYGSDLRVALDRGQRVLDVGGSPWHDLSVASTNPKLSAADALADVRASVKGGPRPRVTSGPQGAQHSTKFSSGDTAQLVIVPAGPGQTRLAWALTYEQSSIEHWFAIVDADTGQVLKRENLVLNASNALVFKRFPGTSTIPSDTQVSVDISTYLSTTSLLSGPNAHAYADLNDNNQADPGEETGPSSGTDFSYPFTPNGAGSGCDANHLCSWNSANSTSFMTNLHQNTTQVFWYVNNYHDHLLAAPIGFDQASGNFQGNDPVQAEADDGASCCQADGKHLDNANFATMPDGTPPRMQMYLFENGTGSFRDINGGDSAAVVYHEYTHGLSSRLDTDSLGLGALFSDQSGAMGEAWSDWYAMDYLVRQGLVTDTSADGEINMGQYTDAVPNQIRTQPMDCPVGATIGDGCPGNNAIGHHEGGYTYGDFGHVIQILGQDSPEVHADGEIWGETLWDLREALINETGSETAGSNAAESLITGGLRLGPPEPSMLDMRNAILAESAAEGGAHTALLWQVFAHRGFGFGASTTGSSDDAPVENFSMPPASGDPTGTLTGNVTDGVSGLPVANTRIGFASFITGATPVGVGLIGAGFSGNDGHYSFPAPVGPSFASLLTSPVSGYDGQSIAGPFTFSGGQTVTRDIALTRDWASAFGGAQIAATNDDSGDPFCGVQRINDQDEAPFLATIGWSGFAPGVSPGNGNPHPGQGPSVTIRLPAAIDITSFGLDPTNNCGDSAKAATQNFMVETSQTGASFSTALSGSFGAGDVGRLNMRTPTGNSSGVRFVRLTLLSAQDGTSPFIDMSEFEVYGAPPNQLPSGTLTADRTSIHPGDSVHFTASMSDPDSKITGTTIDFGDGGGPQPLTGNSADHTYLHAGTFTAVVSASDFRGGAGTASRVISVANAAPAPIVGTANVFIPSLGKKGKLTFTVTLSRGGRVNAQLKIAKKLQKKLKLNSNVVGSVSKSFGKPGTYKVTIAVSKKARQALKKKHMKSLTATLAVKATPTGGAPRRFTKNVKIKL
jgi:extracellular elastinolytic metalloproteinase